MMYTIYQNKAIKINFRKNHYLSHSLYRQLSLLSSIYVSSKSTIKIYQNQISVMYN